MLNMAPAYQQIYNIDGSNTPLTIQPNFFSLSMNCPTICTLYEGHALDPRSLPQASDETFQSFD